jgi:hemerythrin
MNSADSEPQAAVIAWQNDLSVGVAEFETHHKQMIALINSSRLLRVMPT